MPNSRISDQLDMDSLTEVIRGRTSTETASVSSNQLQFTLTDPGNCHIADLPELNLILDKRYFPGLLAMKDERGRREAWCNVASGAAAYAYKTIGSGLSQSTYVPDGNWIYGDWTESNIASTEEMETVIQPEMLDDCVRVMIASVICFFREGQHIPHRRNVDYLMQIIQSNMMNRYGVVEECDKLFLMYTTGRWISKLNILTSVMKQWNSRTKVRAVRTFGLGVVYMPEIIIECFHGVPGGWTDVYLVDCIAEKDIDSSHVFDSDALDGDLKQFNLVHDCDGNLLNVCFQVYGVHT
ncbi:unnamed protein product [Trichobilharzia regenti]|nr:unnamed protein product [Trichobilharzia regenti]